MEPSLNINLSHPGTRISLVPLMKAWEEAIEQGNGRLYNYLIEKLRNTPDLLQPIEDQAIIDKYQQLLDEFLNTVFPVTLSDREHFYAVTFPLSFEVIYSSAKFKKLFFIEDGKRISLPEDSLANLSVIRKAVASQLIFDLVYQKKIRGEVKPLINYKDPVTGLNKYFEFDINNALVTVKFLGDKNELPAFKGDGIQKVNELIDHPELVDWLPLDRFSFEGFSIMQVGDITEKTVISNIKNMLLDVQAFDDGSLVGSLQQQLEDLAGVAGVSIGFTPFFRMNDKLIFPSSFISQSLLVNENTTEKDRDRLFEILQPVFSRQDEPFLVDGITEEDIQKHFFLKDIRAHDFCCLALFPLKHEGKLIGVLELASKEENKISKSVLNKINQAVPLFEIVMHRSADQLESQVNKIIREQYTAIQPSVEWLFTDAAVDYLLRLQQDEEAKLPSIVLKNVFPLYGAIDIRNSSVERNNAIQKDLLEQLELALKIIQKANKIQPYPILKEIAYRIRKYMHAARNIILSDEEMSINGFFKYDIVQLFVHLKKKYPTLEKEIDAYFKVTDTPIEMLYHHRKDFDDSLSIINNTIARYIDREQVKAQKMYPHYFERFVTDGVDFNMYVGQSISPGMEFNTIYLKNLKIWQLTILARAAQLAAKIKKNIPVPLDTTQLMLAHSVPISISFRNSERKFDVDGAYNIRYEIIKKRIDKVNIKDSNERLTQPGKLSIVYSQAAEAKEYVEYIEFLHQEGLLDSEIEYYDLEELQGVAGLKALRVGISEIGNVLNETRNLLTETRNPKPETRNGEDRSADIHNSKAEDRNADIHNFNADTR